MNIEKVTQDLITAVQSYLRRSIEPIVQRVAAVAQRVDGVERRLQGLPEDLSKIKGERGEKGDAGVNGKDGAQGERGEKGDPGERGEKGDPGERGEKGDPGERGEPGQNGLDGEPGERGEPGAKGDKGDPGPQGEKGERGEKGEKGEPGDTGQPGQRGEKGDAGQDGRDALQIDVLDGIDPFKRYQRGTFAQHRGGIVRSFRATDPLGDAGELEKCGWTVAINGIAEIVIEAAEDLRTLTLHTITTSGRDFAHKAVLPVLIDRGIFKAGDTYAAGDVVTWDGSMWIARDTTADKPGTSEAWRLSVKRGRDGRDGLRGEPGQRGASGRDGKDLGAAFPRAAL